LKKFKTKEKRRFNTALTAIARQIVSFADSLDSGIKFEKLFSAKYSLHDSRLYGCEFSFGNGSFFTLQKRVERHAYNRGIPVMYVNPAYTSRRCSRCGEFGRRTQKKFECPACGFVAHADVNAAFNIALSPVRRAEQENVLKIVAETFRRSKKQNMRRLLRCESPVPRDRSIPQFTTLQYCRNILSVLN
jgi:putative transposase